MKIDTEEGKKRITQYGRHSLRLASIGAALILLSVIAVIVAKLNPEGVTRYFTPWSRFACAMLGKIFSIFPFSFGEIMLYVMILGGIASLILLIFRWAKRGGKRAAGRYFSIVLLIAGCLMAFFIGTWGLNYFGKTLDKQIGLDVDMYSKEELFETTRYYLSLANEYSYSVERRAEDGALDTGDIDNLFNSVKTLYERQTIFDFGNVPILKPKAVFSWYIMSSLNIAGIFNPFTAECNVNPDSSPASLPFSACHEMSHRLGYSMENEANFISVILCRESSDSVLRYSGCYMGFIYSYNALIKTDSQAAYSLWDEMSEGVKADILAANTHAAKYADTAAAKISNTVNDTYLKIMNQESGVKSYGEVVDMLIAEYVKGGL